MTNTQTRGNARPRPRGQAEGAGGEQGPTVSKAACARPPSKPRLRLDTSRPRAAAGLDAEYGCTDFAACPTATLKFVKWADESGALISPTYEAGAAGVPVSDLSDPYLLMQAFWLNLSDCRAAGKIVADDGCTGATLP